MVFAFERGECALRRKGLANRRALRQVLDGKAEFFDVDAPVTAAFERAAELQHGRKNRMPGSEVWLLYN